MYDSDLYVMLIVSVSHANNKVLFWKGHNYVIRNIKLNPTLRSYTKPTRNVNTDSTYFTQQ